ncbi:MAG TPA: hypothetical protein VK519_14945 [Pinirhizobacter sp.]|nr:hypothetical protein [Pinirhizobacter sp.]HMH69206.1 hypothetical protein [Pinirhizobacter sp.]
MCEELPTADALRGATDVAVADLPVAAWGAWRLGATGAGAAVFATGVLATLGDGTAGLAACAFLLATTGVFPTGFFAGTALAGAAAGAFAATFFTGAALSGAAFFATGAAFFTGVDFLVAGAVFFTGAFATVFFAGAGLATGFFAGVFTVFTALDALVALTALVALAAWTAGLAGFLAALAPPAAFLAGVLDTAELRVFFAMSFTQCSPPRRRAVIAEYDLPRQPPSEILAPSTVAGAPCARRQPPPKHEYFEPPRVPIPAMALAPVQALD